MKKSFLFLSLFVMIAGFLQGCKSGGINLKLNLQPGTKYAYTMETKTAMEQKAMGQTVNTGQEMTMESTYDVAADGDNRKIAVSYDRIVMNMVSNMMTMQYDSRDPSHQDSMFKGIGGMIGKPFTMVVSDKGEILELSGLNDIISGFGDSTTVEGVRSRKEMAAIFNDSAIRSWMQQSLNFYPGKTVNVGESWNKPLTMNMGGFMKLHIDNKYRLDSVSNGIAGINISSKITVSGGSLPEMKNIQIDMKGQQEGFMTVEVVTGLITDSKIKQTMSGNLNVAAAGMNIPMSVVSNIHMTGRKK